MTWNSMRLGAVAILCGMLLLPTRSAFAGQCGQNPKMPSSFSETVFLNAGLDADGGIHYWFSWGLPSGLKVYQQQQYEIVELCFCEEEEDLCDIKPVVVPSPSPSHIREENAECFWTDEDEDGFLDDCQDITPHNARCQ